MRNVLAIAVLLILAACAGNGGATIDQVVGKTCAGDTNWSSPQRVLITPKKEGDGLHVTISAASIRPEHPEIAKATEWVPGMSSGTLPATVVDNNTFRYHTDLGWNFTAHVTSPDTISLDGSSAPWTHLAWDAICRYKGTAASR